ncbi:mediator of RNA polymerase II transcription subunit 12-like protein isoform X3 [Argopecten irradians]|uniref:mediator of RNA polymerase II transcription subunit 12-like protein isoform X3 n=1 Tax=Argopecten irradians TaxID=31199 RepID=UPI003717063B
MSAYPSQEFRPLKKPKLGPPDVYPQDPKQKEDELTSASVKHGFINSQTFGDEYGSARRENINQEQFGTEFISVLEKKKEVNTFQDTSKKKQFPTKDNFWPAAKNKNAMEAWFKDLAGNKPLFQLGKKVPTFNKRDELFSTMCEFSLPMMKAAWMVKMTAAYNTAMQESKIKKRQMVDQSVDWCQSLTKFMRDQIQKIQDPYHGTPGGPTSGFLTVSTNTNIQIDLDLAIKQWHYSCKLARHMYDEGLVDRNEFLTWMIDLLEKLKQTEDTVLKLVMAQVLQYLDEITMSVLLSRRLAHFAAKKIAQLCGDSGGTSPQAQPPMVNSSGTAIAPANGGMAMPQNPLAAVFSQYNNCPQHRGIILSLSATLQVITLLCPTSLIWNTLGDGKTTSSVLCGSALDLLPCAPSSLPMPPGPENPQIRAQIRAVENQLKMRGRAAEVRWSSDKCQQSTRGFTISKRLEVLDMLDRHNFDKVDSNNSLDTLYNKVFSVHQAKEGVEPMLADEPIIHLLIDWAVSAQRTGNYRAVVVAKLLEKRQNELRTEKFGDTDMIDDKDSLGSDAMVPSGLPAFQGLLMSFLDERAPVLDDNPSDDCRQGFANLIQLFCELIRHDVFSHDAYMCTLISRGDLSSPTTVPQIGVDSMDLSSIKSLSESIKQDVMHQDDIKVDMDINTMDSDYVSLFDCVKDEHKPSPEEPASVKSVKSEKDQPIPSVGGHTHGGMETIQQPKGPSRHMIYAQHFPIPKDAVHECNQRGIVMYGVGKARDDARHYVKKISKETLKLFSKKNCVDTGSGDLGKVKKRKEKEPGDASLAGVVTNFDQIFEGIFGKYQKLSYFDQHAVTAQCTDAVCEQINSFTMGNSSYLPLVDNISYLFDLMEYSLNIYGLLEFSVKLLKELGMVEHTLSSQKSSLAGNYTTFLCLCIVGVFRKYHPYLLVSQDLIIQAFEGLIGAVKDVYNPAVCTSAERCILVYLYNAYTSCSYLRDKKSEMFSNSFKKIKMTLYADINPSASNLLWDPSFMMDFMTSVKSQPDTSLTKQLYDNPANRYSFVCNAMLNICNSQKVDRLNSISVLCAELTARCNSLSSEWLGVLQALCCSSNHSCGFIDVLTQVDVGDMSIHDSLAVFTAILIARHCFSLQDLVVHVVLPSLLAAKPSASGDQDAEPGARLTCHILLKLFKTSEGPLSWKNQAMYNRAPSNIKASCDRHLLAAAHDSITVGPVLAVLKAMLMLSDQTIDEVKTKSSASNKKEEKGGDIFSTLLNSLDDDNMMFGTSQSKGGIESAGLSEFAKHALKEMCAQDWVQEKFLKNPESVLSSDLLLDPMLSNKQAQQLLQMICYPHGIPNQVEGSEPDNKQVIQRILQTLNQWGLRVSLLELQLMLKQATTQSDTNYILENVARGSIDLFHQQTESNRGMNDTDSQSQQAHRSESDGVWMVGPLISKLQGVQGRVLKLAAQVLETGNNFLSKGKFDKERNLRSKSLLGHQPFLSLVLTCLKGQDEQREGLLCSLLNQLEKFINNCKEALDKTPDEFKVRQTIHEALQLRLSLVGGMFDTIQRNTTNTTDWGILLLQLVTNGIVDAQSNNELFTIILDMLTVLIYGTLITEGPEKEENKRTYLNLIKKLRREIGDKNSDSMDKIRQLMPLPKRWYEVITCEPHGTQMDSKGNKYNGLGKKEGLQVSKKEKISPWEVIEGYKNPPPLSWPYFCAVKLERKPLKYEEQHRMLLFHTNSLRQPLSHYLDPPVLPPEDLEPPPEKVEENVKEQAETHQDKPIRKKTSKRRNPRPIGGSSSTFTPTPVQRMNYPDNTMYSTPHPSWSYNHPQPQNTSFYPAQQIPPGPRFTQPSQYGPKQALQTLIRGRNNPNTSNYTQNMQHIHMMSKQMMHRQVRQQLRQTFQNHQRGMPEGQGMFPNQMQPGGMQGMNQPQMGMSSNFGTSYGMQPQPSGNVMEQGPPGAGMMSQPGYNQSYQGSQTSGMMPGMANQPNYMAPQGPQAAPVGQSHFNTTSRLQHGMGNSSMQNPSSTMSGMTSGMGGYNQMASSGPSQHQQSGNDKMTFFHPPASSSSSSSTEEPKGGSYIQRMGPHQSQHQQQQLQMQQRRMMSMPNQQMPSNQAALVAQLQRQISVGPGQAPGQQYNNYPQPPQYQ